MRVQNVYTGRMRSRAQAVQSFARLITIPGQDQVRLVHALQRQIGYDIQAGFDTCTEQAILDQIKARRHNA